MPTVTYQPTCALRHYSTAVHPSSGAGVYVNTRMFTPYGAVVSRSTVSNPEWRNQIARRSDAGAPYLVETQEYRSGYASCEAYGYGANKGFSGEGYYSHCGLYPTNFPGRTDTSLQELALTRLKRKLKKQVGGADALVPVAESREISQTIRGMTKMTTTLLDTLIDIKRTKGLSVLKYASDAWLTYGFGIRPLVDDTFAIAQAIGDYFDEDEYSGIRQSASAKRTWLSHHKVGPYTGIYGANLNYSATLLHTLSYRWYCGGVAEVSSGNDYAGLVEHLGFTGRNLIPTFWELMPFSWVFDYFTTVGAFLEDTFQVSPGMMHYSGYTRRYEVKADCIMSWSAWTGYRIAPSNGVGSFRRFEFQRVPLGGALPHIGLRFRSMDEVGQMGLNKLLNLASVAVQMYRPAQKRNPPRLRKRIVS